MIIGITGGSGCGKTTLLEVIRQKGGVVLDCDEIYHSLLATDAALLEKIGARFPGTVENGALLRRALGEVVFSDPQALLALNEITHAAVGAEVLRRLTPRPALAAIDAIALFEGGLSALCDVTVAVTAPEPQRIARLMARDGISAEYAKKRIHAQKGQDWFRAQAGQTLENNGTAGEFREKCLEFLSRLGIG